MAKGLVVPKDDGGGDRRDPGLEAAVAGWGVTLRFCLVRLVDRKVVVAGGTALGTAAGVWLQHHGLR